MAPTPNSSVRWLPGKRLRLLLAPLLVSLLALALLQPATASAGTLSVVGGSRWVSVGEIFDGDTFRTTRGERIRLLGINTPEVMHDSQPAQPWSQEAKQRLQALIAHRNVELRGDTEKRDRYGRTLAQVYLRDGTWVNRQLIAEGLAQVYTFAPNFRYAAPLLAAEHEARLAGRGLWLSERFRVLDAAEADRRLVGQFRVVRGYIKSITPWRFQLGRLIVTVPRSARSWFAGRVPVQEGERVLVRGTIRASGNGALYLSLHSPYDVAPE